MKFLFRYNILILLAIFTVMALFSVQLGMSALNTASPCPFMGEAMAVCPMTVIDHIGSWKGLFAALPTIEVLALVAAVIVIVSFSLKILAENSAARLAYWYHYYKKKRSASKLYNYFSQLFSQGILNPKVYTL